MTKKKVESKLGWVSPGGPPVSSKSAAEQATQRKKIQKGHRKLESEASKRAADHLGLAADQVPNFQRAFADQLSFYWIECDRRAAEPPSPEQVRVELRELAEGLKLAYGSVHRMSEPARLALLSECRSLYPELGPLRPLLDNLVHTLRQLHAMGESALEKIEGV
jgi:hypothetical protein